GQTYYSQRIANIVVNSFVDRKLRRGKDNKDLTPRELEVLGLIVEGFSKEEIAEKLGISVNTVNIHRKNIMGKLEIHNAIELTKYAIKEGIVQI
ncbi:MAG: response regulator transcription factor, partial [Candidatus Muiribacteriaceae bacterium]